MRQVATALIAIACLAALATDHAVAQPPTVTVGFRNPTTTDVIVRGYTFVNKQISYGTPITVRKNGGMAFESNVLAGYRFYTIHDANQPSRILLLNHQVSLLNRNVAFAIVGSKTNPNQVTLVPDH